jgi:hypothetical protein
MGAVLTGGDLGRAAAGDQVARTQFFTLVLPTKVAGAAVAVEDLADMETPGGATGDKRDGWCKRHNQIAPRR